MRLLVNNTLENLPFEVVSSSKRLWILSLASTDCFLRQATVSLVFQYLWIFQKCSEVFSWRTSGDLRQSSGTKGSGDCRRCSKMLGWYLLIFRRVQGVFSRIIIIIINLYLYTNRIILHDLPRNLLTIMLKIHRGYYTVAKRYEFYVRVARTISHEWAQRTSGILFLPREHKVHIF